MTALRTLRNTASIRPPKKSQKISIIILSAGLGTRMKSYGPKPLISVGNSNIVSRQLAIIDTTIKIQHEIIIVIGYGAQTVLRKLPHNIVKVENERYETTNVTHSIYLALNACTTDNVLMIYGDLVFNEQTLCLPFNCSWLSTNTTMSDNEVGCIIDDNQSISNLSYGLNDKWSQIGFFTNKELKLLYNICAKEENKQVFGFEVMNKIIENGGTFKHVRPTNTKINDIDCTKDLALISDWI